MGENAAAVSTAGTDLKLPTCPTTGEQGNKMTVK